MPGFGAISRAVQARDLGQAVLDLTKSYMNEIGAFDIANMHVAGVALPDIDGGGEASVRLPQRMSIDLTPGAAPLFYVNGRPVASAAAMVDGAVTDFLRDAQPIGGDILTKRAIVGAAGAPGYRPVEAMALAAQYETYLADSGTGGAGPGPALPAAAAAEILAGAEALGLARAGESDFNGGLGGFVASLIDAGIATDIGDVTVVRGAGGEVSVDVAVRDAASIPPYLALFSDRATVSASGDGAAIRLDFSSGMAGVG
ncbi:MAG: hypothetical protein ACU0AT_10415 [Tranquillimonas sp.]